jgi:hypothetical protein
MEEQIGGVGAVGEIADFVDDQLAAGCVYVGGTCASSLRRGDLRAKPTTPEKLIGRLANRRLQPLGHLTVRGFPKDLRIYLARKRLLPG